MTQDEAAAILAALAEAHEDLTVKGKASRYLAVSGNMFAFVDGSGEFCIRLSRQDRAAFAQAGHDAGDVIRYNSVMRDYVRIPDAVVADRAAVAAWFERSVAFARGLKPKPTKKPKA